MRSISIKVSILVSVLFVAAILATGAIQARFLREEFTRLAFDQQRSHVEGTARDLDEQFATRRRVLLATAGLFGEAEVANPALAASKLRAHPALLELFDDLLILDPQGRIVSDYPEVTGRRGVDASDRAFFREVVATRQLVVSEPVLGKARLEPIFQFAVPLHGPSGGLAGVLVGVIRLSRASFVGALSDRRIGQSGYYAILTRGNHPVYVVHPDRARLLKPRRQNGAPAVTRALAGEDGSWIDTSSEGVSNLYSARSLKSVPWLLVAVQPMEEIFSPLAVAERRVWLGSAAAAMGVMLLAWASIAWQLGPLARLRRAIDRLRGEPGAPLVPVPVARDDEVGELTAAFNTLMEERQHAERARARSEERLQLVTDNVPVLVSYLDPELRVRFANACYRRWFGLEPAEMAGRTLVDLFGAEVAAIGRPFLDAALQGQSGAYEIEAATTQGARVLRTSVIPHIDAGGRVVGIFRMSVDVTDDRAHAGALQTLACQDPLTGLLNRRGLDENLPLVAARQGRNGGLLALLFIDLDRFKAVNDNLGHAAGDEVLRAVADRLRMAVRVTDVVARLGGDEFVVALEALHEPAEAATVATKVIDLIAKPVMTSAGAACVGASVGIAVGDGEASPEDLLCRADAAAYEAKRSGRANYCFAPETYPSRLVIVPLRPEAREPDAA